MSRNSPDSPRVSPAAARRRTARAIRKRPAPARPQAGQAACTRKKTYRPSEIETRRSNPRRAGQPRQAPARSPPMPRAASPETPYRHRFSRWLQPKAAARALRPSSGIAERVRRGTLRRWCPADKRPVSPPPDAATRSAQARAPCSPTLPRRRRVVDLSFQQFLDP